MLYFIIFDLNERLNINERFEYKPLSLTYKVLTTS